MFWIPIMLGAGAYGVYANWDKAKGIFEKKYAGDPLYEAKMQLAKIACDLQEKNPKGRILIDEDKMRVYDLDAKRIFLPDNKEVLLNAKGAPVYGDVSIFDHGWDGFTDEFSWNSPGKELKANRTVYVKKMESNGTTTYHFLTGVSKEDIFAGWTEAEKTYKKDKAQFEAQKEEAKTAFAELMKKFDSLSEDEKKEYEAFNTLTPKETRILDEALNKSGIETINNPNSRKVYALKTLAKEGKLKEGVLSGLDPESRELFGKLGITFSGPRSESANRPMGGSLPYPQSTTNTTNAPAATTAQNQPPANSNQPAPPASEDKGMLSTIMSSFGMDGNFDFATMTKKHGIMIAAFVGVIAAVFSGKGDWGDTISKSLLWGTLAAAATYFIPKIMGFFNKPELPATDKAHGTSPGNLAPAASLLQNIPPLPGH